MQQGTVEIKLSKPIKVNGAETSTLTMREPTVGDQLVMDAMSGSPAVKEMQLLANLCGVASDDLKAMSLKDYAKLQKAFTGFLDLHQDTSEQGR